MRTLVEGAEQLPLALPVDEAMGADDFVPGAANSTALEAISAWPDWPAPVLLLTGPAASGKSHLVRVFAAMSGAATIGAARLPAADPFGLVARGAVAVEDADRDPDALVPLFHLLNAAGNAGVRVLVTARRPPGDWAAAVPDLASRLRAAHPIALGAPDDALLAQVLVKLLADRQLTTAPRALHYAIRHMERSFAAAARLAAAADRRTLAGRRPLTRAVIAAILADGGGGSPPSDPQADRGPA